jgi:DNA-binding NarL/FixJ family response regulator
MLSNTEVEKLVLDLYNQGKNIRQIAKEASMSFRDITTIIQKATAKLRVRIARSNSNKALIVVMANTSLHELTNYSRKERRQYKWL